MGLKREERKRGPHAAAGKRRSKKCFEKVSLPFQLIGFSPKLYIPLIVSIDTLTDITGTELEIIAHLVGQEYPKTIRGLAREIKKSYPLVHHGVQKLLKWKVLTRQDAPPSQLISISPYAPVQYLLEAEQHHAQKFLQQHPWFFLYLQDILWRCPSTFFTLLVFGSYAKGTVTPNSDLDILVIMPQEDKSLTEVFYQPATKVKKHLLFVTEHEFKEMICKPMQLNIGNQAKTHHILIYGGEQYYALVRQALR